MNPTTTSQAGERTKTQNVFAVKRTDGIIVCRTPPRFVAKHEYDFSYLGEIKTRRGKKPDTIWLGDMGFAVNAINEVKQWPDKTIAIKFNEADSAKIQAMDEHLQKTIDALHQARKAFLAEAATRASKVSVEDTKL